MNALLDSDVLLDFLDGHAAAANEIARYRECCISIISWIELMVGGRSPADQQIRREFLNHFRLIPLTEAVAESAVKLRQDHGIKLPDAIIWASALTEDCLLVTRNMKDFPARDAGVRFPYRR